MRRGMWKVALSVVVSGLTIGLVGTSSALASGSGSASGAPAPAAGSAHLPPGSTPPPAAPPPAAKATCAGQRVPIFSVTACSGDGQTATVGTAYPRPLQVSVTAIGLVGVPGLPVVFTAPSRGASGVFQKTGRSTEVDTTDRNGLATSTPFVADKLAGPVEVTARLNAPVRGFAWLSNVATFHLVNAPGPLDHLALSPSTSAIPAGGSVTYTAQGFDSFGNSLGDVTGSTAFTIAPDGSCTSAICTASVSGLHTVTGTDSGKTGAASVKVNPGPAASISAVSGGGQSTTIGAAFGQPLTVNVSDAFGNAVAGTAVTFVAPVAGPGGTFMQNTAESNAAGQASTTVTANTAAGSWNALATAAGTTSASFSLTNSPGPAAGVAVSLQPSSILANGSSTATATATVTDADNNPRPGDQVVFSSNGDDTFGPVTDNGNGTYTAVITSSTTLGTQTITATDNGVSGTAILTQTVGPPAGVDAVSGGGQSTQVGTTFGQQLTVRVTDAAGHPVPGAVVSFAAPATGPGGSLSSATAITDNNGLAGVTATANTVAGSWQAVASVEGAQETATFDLTNVPGPAAGVAVSLQPSSILADGSSTATATATVKDDDNNPRPGDTVVFSTSGDDTLGPVTDNGDGTYTVTITASKTLGIQTITATDNGVTGTAALAQTLGPPAGIDAVGGAGQSAAPGQAFAQPLVAQVTDAAGHPVSGATVTFTAPSGGAGGAFSADSATTDSSGDASVNATANQTSGPWSAVASVAGVTQTATFALTNTTPAAPVPASISVEADPSSVSADGEATSLVTATVKDAGGNPLPGQNVTFASEGVDGVLMSDVVDNGDGTYSVNVSGDTVGTATISATAGGVTASAQVHFTAPPGGGTTPPTRGRPLPPPKKGGTEGAI